MKNILHLKILSSVRLHMLRPVMLDEPGKIFHLGRQRLVDTTCGRQMVRSSSRLRRPSITSKVSFTEQQDAEIVTFCLGTCVAECQPLLAPLLDALLHLVCGWHSQRPTESTNTLHLGKRLPQCAVGFGVLAGSGQVV